VLEYRNPKIFPALHVGTGNKLHFVRVVPSFWKKMQKECIEHHLGNERSDKIKKVVKAMKKVVKGKYKNFEESDEDSKNEECGSIICICHILDCLEENLQWLRCDFCKKW
uniref:Uncharacterized protein n=1 Tax=Romanomermis culicivorax TaxID=13658 RepID=A0A915JZP2_ROMCU